MRAGLLAIVLSVTWMANDEVRADDNCQIQRFNFNITSEGPWPARMTVKAGKSCGSRRWSFGTITPSRLYLADQARHGKVTLSYPGGYQYSPAAGYVGSDSFTLRLCGTKNGGYQGCANIRFDVSVIAQP